MTLHAAKGLEFDAAVLTGMEENVFPHSRATAETDPEELAEERRLCYVGITRARRRLAFSLAGSRALFGDLKFNEPSRFLSDVPKELFGFELPTPVARNRPPTGEHYLEREPAYEPDDLDHSAPDEFDQRSEHERRAAVRGTAIRTPRGAHASAANLHVGDRVLHASFGEGLVIGARGSGPDATVVVRFPGIGERRIVARFLSTAE